MFSAILLAALALVIVLNSILLYRLRSQETPEARLRTQDALETRLRADIAGLRADALDARRQQAEESRAQRAELGGSLERYTGQTHRQLIEMQRDRADSLRGGRTAAGSADG